jgi:hypothetical protein
MCSNLLFFKFSCFTYQTRAYLCSALKKVFDTSDTWTLYQHFLRNFRTQELELGHSAFLHVTRAVSLRRRPRWRVWHL